MMGSHNRLHPLGNIIRRLRAVLSTQKSQQVSVMRALNMLRLMPCEQTQI